MDVQHIRQTVVVGVDGSGPALRAVRWGAAEAGLRRVPLRLVIAFGWPADHGIGRPRHGEGYRDVLLERARGQLAEAAAAAVREEPDIEVEQQLVVGSPISALCAEAQRAQIVAIGDSGTSRVVGLLVGSVAVGLAVHASCPVVVVRGAEQEPSATASLPILVGVDGTSSSEAAIAYAFETAAARGAPLVAVHTWSDVVFDPSTSTGMVDCVVVEAAARQLLSERLAGWAEKFPDVPVEQVVTRDGPAHSLLAQAARAQLVVVGSRGRGEFSGLLLGSVSHALLHRAPCPVAVVRDPEAHA
jgi:nucleotide-binding universal stress UspA family protein